MRTIVLSASIAFAIASVVVFVAVTGYEVGLTVGMAMQECKQFGLEYVAILPNDKAVCGDVVVKVSHD